MRHLKVGVSTGVLLGLQRMNGGPIWVCRLFQQVPQRLMAEQDLLMTLKIHELQRQLLLLPELLPIKVHVRWLLLQIMPWLKLMLWMCCVTLPWQLL